MPDAARAPQTASSCFCEKNFNILLNVCRNLDRSHSVNIIETVSRLVFSFEAILFSALWEIIKNDDWTEVVRADVTHREVSSKIYYLLYLPRVGKIMEWRHLWLSTDEHCLDWCRWWEKMSWAGCCAPIVYTHTNAHITTTTGAGLLYVKFL